MSITIVFHMFFNVEGGGKGSFPVGVVAVALHDTDLQLSHSVPAEELDNEVLVGFRIMTDGQVWGSTTGTGKNTVKDQERGALFVLPQVES